MKCVVCRGRKGKRHCPAYNAPICPRCCGEKRVVEIPCPADCVYLGEGTDYEYLRAVRLEAAHAPERLARLERALQRFPEAFSLIERTLAQTAAEIGSLGDAEALLALELCEKNLQTEEKGIIYQHGSSNPLAESVSRDLSRCLEDLKNGDEEAGIPRFRNRDLLECLSVVRSDIEMLRRRQSGGRVYLHYVQKRYPEVSRKGLAKPLIEL